MIPADQAAFYDRVWSIGHVWSPTAWPEWALIAPRLIGSASAHRLEIGGGLRPRLPVTGTYFADISTVALGKLAAAGGLPIRASADALPLPNGAMDVVAACELLEHLPDDEVAFAEIARVLRPGGWFFCSMPLQPALWTDHDRLAGHYRRYQPAALADTLAAHGFRVTDFSPGLAGGYAPLKALGAWAFAGLPRLSIWLEDRVIMPLGARAQKTLRARLPAIPPETHAPSAFIACQRINPTP